MNVCVIKEDRVVMIDGEGINFDFDLPSNVWAIQWNGTSGHIEYNDGTPNEELTDFSDYQYLVDGYATEEKNIKELLTLEDEGRLSSQTYSLKREIKYSELNQFEMQFDDQRDGTTTWLDAINAIKSEIPKT